MKNLLPILLIHVLMTSQVYALSGGPRYPGGGSVDAAGFYSGTLTDTAKNDPNASEASGALGIFDLVVPDAGVSNGQFLVFVQGRQCFGQIEAMVEPGGNSLVGIVEGSTSYSQTRYNGATATDDTVTQTVSGLISGKVGYVRGPSGFGNGVSATTTLEIRFDQTVGETPLPTVSQQIHFAVNGLRM